MSREGLIGNFLVTYLFPFLCIQEDRISVYKRHSVDTGTLAWEAPFVVFFILCVCVCVCVYLKEL